MPRPLQIDNALLGHVMTDNDVGIFTRLANLPSNLPEQVTAVTAAVGRYDGRITALERENAALREGLRVATDQLRETHRVLQSLVSLRTSPGGPTEAVPQMSGSTSVTVLPGPADAGRGGAAPAAGAAHGAAVPSGGTAAVGAPAAVPHGAGAGVPTASVAAGISTAGAPGGGLTAAAPSNVTHATLDQLRSALQAYAQRHGVENARRFMQSLGFNAVGQVPAERRDSVIAAIRGAGELPVGAAISTPAAG
jgi:hypothetical protein